MNNYLESLIFVNKADRTQVQLPSLSQRCKNSSKPNTPKFLQCANKVLHANFPNLRVFSRVFLRVVFYTSVSHVFFGWNLRAIWRISTHETRMWCCNARGLYCKLGWNSSWKHAEGTHPSPPHTVTELPFPLPVCSCFLAFLSSYMNTPQDN